MTQSISSQLPLEKIIQDGPVDPNEYVVGPGDIFNVGIWSTVPLTFQVPVTPEGSVVIPTVGEIFISGKTLFDARELVLKEIKKKYISGNATFTLYVPRQFTVTVSGMVLNEGIYTVSATQRVDALLQTANNEMQLKEKSFTQDFAKIEEEATGKLSAASKRHIKIMRKNGNTVLADIIRFYGTHNTSSNPLLQDGDVVVVPPSNISKDYIGIHGAVAIEGTYEFVEGDSLTTLLAIAGGLTSYADPERIMLVRSSNEGGISETPVSYNDIETGKSPDIPLRAGDRIIVGKKNSFNRGGVVSIEGEVQHPGSYPIIQDSTLLTEIIKQAGGFTNFALLSAAKVLRPAGGMNNKLITYQLLRKGYTTSEDTAYFHNEILLKSKGEFVSTDFTRLFTKDDKTQNITLRDGDKIIVPTKTNSVYVFGEVKHPGNVQFIAGERVEYYINKAGGMTDHAQSGDIRIVKASTKQWLDPSETTIEEGDYIWVPKEPYRPFTYYLTVYSQIFGVVGTVVSLLLLITK
ncbi:MAG: SLBB domain-containing protein [Bacteroidota bacterium]